MGEWSNGTYESNANIIRFRKKSKMMGDFIERPRRRVDDEKQDKAQEVFRKMPKERDEITKFTFLSYIRSRYHTLAGQEFDKVDANSNGSLDIKEFRQVFPQLT